jgi:hypothetical protein
LKKTVTKNLSSWKGDSPMKTEKKDDVFVKVKDMAGNEFVCPLNELRNVKNVSEEELENCFEGDVVGRYAGQLNIVDSGD